ncbi:MAG: TIGR00341 family protein [Gammaproteobacteria bacterium]|nr:TIGR00341 family protein [Gammaproteobacteria bacterium]MCB1926240.1 TIGR00341 family protein [Gammaproteobacteria bacterium]
MRLIEVVADAGHTDTLAGIADQHEITDYWWGAPADDGRRAFRMLVSDAARQPVMDALQSVFGGSENYRIVVQAVETALPREPEDEAVVVRATREELYAQIAKGAHIDSNFLLLVVLSTVVAAIGLIEDNVAVVIGAMVIAPLLGPILALAFASTLGDSKLVWRALRTGTAGLALAFLVALMIGLSWPTDIARGEMLIASSEILSRTDVGIDGMALALASGAAAVLSLTTGLSTTLVGVMVAVALLPPTATTAMLLGAGHAELALGAALLLAVNVVCVMVAAKLVFMLKGVQPRTWYERSKARQSTRLSSLFWVLLLLVLLAVVVLRHRLLL